MITDMPLEMGCPECGRLIEYDYHPEEPEVGLPEGWVGVCMPCQVTWLLTDGDVRELRHGR